MLWQKPGRKLIDLFVSYRPHHQIAYHIPYQKFAKFRCKSFLRIPQPKDSFPHRNTQVLVPCVELSVKFA